MTKDDWARECIQRMKKGLLDQALFTAIGDIVAEAVLEEKERNAELSGRNAVLACRVSQIEIFERERCAVIASEGAYLMSTDPSEEQFDLSFAIAAKIREGKS